MDSLLKNSCFFFSNQQIQFLKSEKNHLLLFIIKTWKTICWSINFNTIELQLIICLFNAVVHYVSHNIQLWQNFCWFFSWYCSYSLSKNSGNMIFFTFVSSVKQYTNNLFSETFFPCSKVVIIMFEITTVSKNGIFILRNRLFCKNKQICYFLIENGTSSIFINFGIFDTHLADESMHNWFYLNIKYQKMEYRKLSLLYWSTLTMLLLLTTGWNMCSVLDFDFSGSSWKQAITTNLFFKAYII